MLCMFLQHTSYCYKKFYLKSRKDQEDAKKVNRILLINKRSNYSIPSTNSQWCTTYLNQSHDLKKEQINYIIFIWGFIIYDLATINQNPPSHCVVTSMLDTIYWNVQPEFQLFIRILPNRRYQLNFHHIKIRKEKA